MYPPTCGLSGFALQPVPEHVGYSHCKHARSRLFLCCLEGLNSCQCRGCLQALQTTVSNEEGPASGAAAQPQHIALWSTSSASSLHIVGAWKDRNGRSLRHSLQWYACRCGFCLRLIVSPLSQAKHTARLDNDLCCLQCSTRSAGKASIYSVLHLSSTSDT